MPVARIIEAAVNGISEHADQVLCEAAGGEDAEAPQKVREPCAGDRGWQSKLPAQTSRSVLATGAPSRAALLGHTWAFALRFLDG